MLRRISHGLLSILAVTLWCAAAHASQQTAAMTETVPVRWLDGGVSPYEAERQARYAVEDGTEPVAVTLWSEHRGELLTVGDGSTDRVIVTVLELYGDCTDICSSEIVCGAFPQQGDSDGCALSEDAAFALWGGTDVVGMQLYWDTRLLTVRGVYRGAGAAALVQAEPTDIQPMTFMQVHLDADDAAVYLNSSGYLGGQLLDLPLLNWIAQLLYRLPAIALTVGICGKFSYCGLYFRNRRAVFAAYLFAALLTALYSGRLLRVTGSIPPQLIPSRLSDFAAWTAIFTGWAQDIRDWLMVPSTRDITLLSWTAASLFLSMAALVLTVAVMRRCEIVTVSAFLAGSTASMLLVWMCASAYAKSGGLTVDRFMLILPVMWLAADSVTRAHRGTYGAEQEAEELYEPEIQ